VNINSSSVTHSALEDDLFVKLFLKKGWACDRANMPSLLNWDLCRTVWYLLGSAVHYEKTVFTNL